MSILNSPCKDCPDRSMTCHDTCPEYLEYKKVRENISKQRLENYTTDPDCKVYKGKHR